jgi:RNA polymerase sigma factor for flagellar operon FliA
MQSVRRELAVPVADPPEVLDRFHAELDLVEIVARQVIRATSSTIDLDDLLSAGREGLLAAARRFDPSQQATFRTYADYRVRGAMLDEIRKMSALPRRAYARLAALEAASAYSEGDWEAPGSDTEMSEGDAERALDEHLAAMAAATAIAVVVDASRGDTQSKTSIAPGDDPEQAFATAELMERVRRELDYLTEARELTTDAREIIQRHYFEGQSISQIARELNIDKSWASRQHSRAIARLAERLREPESIH